MLGIHAEIFLSQVPEIIIRRHITLISFDVPVLLNPGSKLCNWLWFIFSQITKNVFFTDYELVRLPEDATLCGFTPLMYNDQEPIYTSKETDMVSFYVAASLERVIKWSAVKWLTVAHETPLLKMQWFFKFLSVLYKFLFHTAIVFVAHHHIYWNVIYIYFYLFASLMKFVFSQMPDYLNWCNVLLLADVML